MALLSFLDREKSVAHPGYSRWLVPPAALAIHLCIGQVYAFSVFKIPLTQVLGITKSVAGDWSQSQLAWIFSLAIAILGLSAAIFGEWLEGAGPRKAMFASATCFAAGFFISYFGVVTHQLWLIYFGYGVVGGIGLGLGYISPVSTLIKWFPDRPGLATGMAIMGFGGGAMIGSPLAIKLMAHFKTAQSVGVAPTFVVMGIVYFALHDVRRLHHPRATARLEARRLDRARTNRNAWSPLTTSRSTPPSAPAILAAVDRPVHQRHRRHRHPRASLPDDSGVVQGRGRPRRRRRICRPAQPLQHGRTLLLGLHLRLHRPQAHLLHLLHRRSHRLFLSAPNRWRTT